jgi:hypothetical protein
VERCETMNRCAVDGCSEAAWTHWKGFDLCERCSAAAWVWATEASTLPEAAAVVRKIETNLRTHGTRSGPDESSR